MPRKEWKSISVPTIYVDTINQFIEEKEGEYVSVSEVTRDALREFLERNAVTTSLDALKNLKLKEARGETVNG